MIIQEITNISYNGLYVRDNNLFEHEHIYVCKSERFGFTALIAIHSTCLLYTSPSPRDLKLSRMPSSA